ncbi:MAG: HNH endonuclease [Caryophanon sp.]|nr:HNH endonuclease [Caryophanon sp.]
MLKSFSWVIDDAHAVKYLDKSAFLHGETGIPKDIAPYFNLDDTIQSKRPITLLYNDVAYEAMLYIDPKKRFKLSWKKDFAKRLEYKFSTFVRLYEEDKKEEIATLQAPLLRFKTNEEPNTYEVEMLNVNIEEEQAVFEEGRPMHYFITRYERLSVVREAALELHGYDCAACRFNFEKTYGELGKHFIEIHHVNPLSRVKEKHEINPATDVVPLCANCHRMVHRQSSHVLTIEELQRILEQTKEREQM